MESRRAWLPRVADFITHPDEEAMRVLALPDHERHAAWREWLSDRMPNLSEAQLGRAAQYMEEHHHDMLMHVVKEMMDLRRELEIYRTQIRHAVARLIDTELAAALTILECGHQAC